MQEAVESAAYLREQAEKCVRLAKDLSDHEAAAALRNMAMEYLIVAERIELAQRCEPIAMPPTDLGT